MTFTDFDIVARTLYGEARGEYATVGLGAFIAIANVIHNRVHHPQRFGHTPTEVCLKPKQFSCWNVGDPNRLLIQEKKIEDDPLFRLAHMATQKVLQGLWPDLTRGSDHYHSTSCAPRWARRDKVQLRLGNHIFYKIH